MKRVFLLFCLPLFIAACNNNAKTAAAGTDTTTKTSMDMPYKASYSSNFTNDVPDSALHMVLTSYKDWADGNMTGLGNAMGDSVSVDFNMGDHFHGTRAGLMQIWSKLRDSLSSVAIDMEAWQKLYEPTKKQSFIVTWYKETDTYKIGKVDSAYYNDINEVKDGKISWYSQYRRPAK